MINVIIIGASGHGHVVEDIVNAAGDKFLGYLDDDKSKKNVLGSIDDCDKFNDAEFIIAIGDPVTRERISTKNLKWYTAIHPSAIISNDSKIDEGTVVMPNVVINSGARIGKHCIVNTSAVIEHDNLINDFVHISVGAKLGGNVSIGKKTWIGIGATVINNISISDNCMIGAGAVVVNDIDKFGTYVGLPARLIK